MTVGAKGFQELRGQHLLERLGQKIFVAKKVTCRCRSGVNFPVRDMEEKRKKKSKKRRNS